MVVVKDLELWQFDIAIAFPNGTLQEKIFMDQPIEFTKTEKIVKSLLIPQVSM
jgi:hypothetical protein